MTKRNKTEVVSKDHPEVTEIKNICNISPQSPQAKDICKKISKGKNTSPLSKTKD